MVQGGIGVQGELRLAGLGLLIPGMDNGLAQTSDPLLLAEGVVGLQGILVSFGAPPAAHTETVFYWEKKQNKNKDKKRKNTANK